MTTVYVLTEMYLTSEGEGVDFRTRNVGVTTDSAKADKWSSSKVDRDFESFVIEDDDFPAIRELAEAVKEFTASVERGVPASYKVAPK